MMFRFSRTGRLMLTSALLCLGGISLAAPVQAQAQPATAPAPAVPTSTAVQVPVAAAMPARGAAGAPPDGGVTPAMVQAQMEERLRAALASMGITDAATLNAVLDHLAEDAKARQAVWETWRAMVKAVRKEDTVPEELRGALVAYKAALEADRTRRTQAQAALDAKIGFSTKPRLEAVLLMVGVLGDNPQPVIPLGGRYGGPAGNNDKPRGGPGGPDGPRGDKERGKDGPAPAGNATATPAAP